MIRPLLLLALATLPLAAQEAILRQVIDAPTDSHIEVTALFSFAPPGGYLPVRVKLANNLATARSATLSFSSGIRYGQANTSNSRYQFSADAGKTVTYDIVVPVVEPKGYGYGMVDVMLGGSFGSTTSSVELKSDPGQPAVLMSAALYTPNASKLDSAASSKSSGSYGRSSTEFAAKFDPAQTPDDWRAYAGFDSILMLDSDWTKTPAGARNAILASVRLGSQLVIYSTGSLVQASLGIPDDPVYGQVDIRSISSSLDLDPSSTLTLVERKRHKLRHASLADHTGGWPLQDSLGMKDFRYAIFICVLVIFAIMVGPVNLFVFAKSGRRHRLFITTPIISLATSLLLVVIIILQDGFGGDGKRLVLMEVRPDAGSNAAFIHQEQFSRSGVLTRTNFTMETPALLSQVPINKSHWARYTGDSDSVGSFDFQPLSGGKAEASGDWFQSRSEQGQVLTAVLPTRGRIETSASADTLVSTFDFPIETLYLLGADGVWRKAADIAPGKPFKLAALEDRTRPPEINDLTNRLDPRHFNMLDKASKRPGHFVAVTSAGPAIDTHPGIRWKETLSIITGPVVTP